MKQKLIKVEKELKNVSDTLDLNLNNNLLFVESNIHDTYIKIFFNDLKDLKNYDNENFKTLNNFLKSINEEKKKYLILHIMNQDYEKIDIDKGAVLKNIILQKTKGNGYFYRNISGTQDFNSSYQNFILSSGLKFNKIEIDMNLKNEKSSCHILSGLNLRKEEHQEIKTQINHLAPNCKSYQKIKNVLENDSRGVYQGKIFVKDIAQKILKENKNFKVDNFEKSFENLKYVSLQLFTSSSVVILDVIYSNDSPFNNLKIKLRSNLTAFSNNIQSIEQIKNIIKNRKNSDDKFYNNMDKAIIKIENEI